ncbi:MAG: Hsp20/alpha crystallin family protein [Clostridiales bacterium]|nr:Hsp20/alpha crystallin family protein [Clostridiales bacterium]
MLYLPTLFGGKSVNDLVDDWMNDLDRDFISRKNPLYGHNAKNLMRTDVRELDDHYELAIDLPGFDKDQVQLSLEDGYLTISASKGLNKEEKDEKTGRIIRQERYAGEMQRSFYVGEDIEQEDIKAKMEHGLLTLNIAKKDPKEKAPEKKTITID